MDIDREHLAQLRDLMLRALSHDNNVRREAERQIEGFESQPGFSLILLRFVAAVGGSPSQEDRNICQSSAVLFKNIIKKHWAPEDDDKKPLAQADKENLKAHIVDYMCRMPSYAQNQLAEALAIMSKHDFPSNWQNLLPQLVEKLAANDVNVIYGVLLCTNSILKRFRNAFQTDDLLLEYAYCLKLIQEPLLQLYMQAGRMLEAASAKDDIILVLQILRLITRIFYSLNWQELPEYFEDHMGEWMTEFAKYFQYKNPLVKDDDNLLRLLSAIIENLVLYATKYEEEFQPHLPVFTQFIWQLLLEMTSDQKYDILATISIKFLTSMSSKAMNKNLFTDDILGQIVEHIVIRNIMTTDMDEELFEMNPMDYIRKDMEGSDVDTRRRCSIELIRTLMKLYADKVTELCLQYINMLLSQYQSTRNWKLKDAALNLIIAVSVNTYTQSQGAAELNPRVNILEFFGNHVMPEVQSKDVNDLPIIKADAMKLLCTFRQFFQAPFILELFPHLIRYLSSEHVVVQTYAALCIEKFLSIKEKTTPPSYRVPKESLMQYLNPLFSSLFFVLENTDVPENDYVMKCIMRILSVVDKDITPVTELVLQRLATALGHVCKNPANPHFNHYLFECVALLVRASCAPSPSTNTAALQNACNNFEAFLFPPFQSILQLDVVEFVPYVFQILAQLLHYRPQAGLSEAYQALFPPLVSAVLWDRKGNVPALTDLIRVYIAKGLKEIVSMRQLDHVLGVFQKLLSSKANEVYAFKILNALVVDASLDILSPYFSTILQLLLRRLQDNKSIRYYKLFVLFLCVFATVHGPNILFDALESIQTNMVTMIVMQVWDPLVEHMSIDDDSEAAYFILGASRFLFESKLKGSHDAWCMLVKDTVTVMHNKSTAPTFDDLADNIESREFDSSYSKLAFAQIPDKEPPHDRQQACVHFAKALCTFASATPGKYPALLQNVLKEDGRAELSQIITSAGLKLV